MSNVIPFNFSPSSAKPTTGSEEKPNTTIDSCVEIVPSKLDGGVVVYVKLNDSIIEQLGDICKKQISTSPKEVLFSISFDKAITDTHSFDGFIRSSMQIFDNIYNDVIMDAMADLHEGISIECREALLSELTAFVCKIKHMVATDLYPVAGFLIQFSITTLGLMVSCIYGTPDKAKDYLRLLTFPFKLKED